MAKWQSGKQQNNKMVEGKTQIFTSVLVSDFCQVLQQTPKELFHPIQNKLPRLLVDSTGDGAIMMNPENGSKSSTKSRRSDLVRLPPAPKSSG